MTTQEPTKTTGTILEFRTALRAEGEGLGLFPATNRPSLGVAPPPEFGGPGNRWTPEEMLLGAVESCMMTTFYAIAKRKRLDVKSYRSHVLGELSKGRRGYEFSEVILHIELLVAETDRDLAKDLLERAHAACIIGNALKTPVTLRAIVLHEPRPDLDDQDY